MQILFKIWIAKVIMIQIYSSELFLREKDKNCVNSDQYTEYFEDIWGSKVGSIEKPESYITCLFLVLTWFDQFQHTFFVAYTSPEEVFSKFVKVVDHPFERKCVKAVFLLLKLWHCDSFAFWNLKESYGDVRISSNWIFW